MIKSKIFKNLKLDKEEQKIEKALGKDEFVSAPDFKKTQKLFKTAAENYIQLQKSKRITIRVNNEDLLILKAKAKNSKIPYQILLGILIHKYTERKIQIGL